MNRPRPCRGVIYQTQKMSACAGLDKSSPYLVSLGVLVSWCIGVLVSWWQVFISQGAG